MHRVIDISLAGHAEPYRLHDDAFEALQQYLDRAKAGLAGDPDHSDVLRDLEQSIGDKLDARLHGGKRVIDADDVSAVLDEIGSVDADGPAPAQAPASDAPAPKRRRRLYRIREGQEWAGICNGLAEYAELDVSMVRWTFVLLAIVTAGALLLAYVIGMFVLPVVPNRQAYLAELAARDQGA